MFYLAKTHIVQHASMQANIPGMQISFTCTFYDS